MHAIRTAAIAIAARIRAIAPADQIEDPSTPAGAAIADMDAIAAGEWDRPSDAETAAWMIDQAAEATAEYTTDGCEDEAAREAADAIAE